MNGLGVAFGMVLVLAGIAGTVVAGLRLHARGGALAYLTELEGTGTGIAAADPEEPALPSFGERVVSPTLKRVTRRVRAVLPGQHLDRVHQQLLHAGLSTTMRAEEFVTAQVAIVGAFLVGGIVICAAVPGSTKVKVFLAFMLVFCAAMAPPSWLARRVRSRTEAIQRDLPDVLDLLTIAVEAGLGLEQAMEAACADMQCPMTEEMARTLQEISLGLSRHQAFDNLRTRSPSTDLASFVTVLTQADVLGMPIGRVLRTQADEMRARRRARAREQAAKLPVKILFPLMFFILPPLMIVVIGPAAAGIGRLFGF